MKKTDARIRKSTAREQSFGPDKDKIVSLVQRLSRKPKRRLGGVSDMHIELMEGMSEDEIDAMNDTP